MEPITSLASLKRVLRTPGVVMIMDENSRMAHSIQRYPAAMEVAGNPRKIKEVRSNDVILVRSDGSEVYQSLPASRNLVTYGDNSFTISSDDGKDRISFRIVDPSQPYEPSRLAINHPPLSPEAVQAEKRAIAEKEQAAAERQKKAWDEYQRINSLPPVAPDVQYQAYRTACEAVIREAISNREFINDDTLSRLISSSPIVHEVDFTELTRGTDIILTRNLIPRESSNILMSASHELAAEPRGTWRRVLRIDEGQQPKDVWPAETWDSAIVSMGDGHTIDIVSYDSSKELTEDEIHNRMLRHDTYTFRNDIEKQIKQERILAEQARITRKLEKYAFSIGASFNNVSLAGQNFSTATISAISDTGELSLILTKSRSKKTWTANLSPADLVRILPDGPETPHATRTPSRTPSP